MKIAKNPGYLGHWQWAGGGWVEAVGLDYDYFDLSKASLLCTLLWMQNWNWIKCFSVVTKLLELPKIFIKSLTVEYLLQNLKVYLTFNALLKHLFQYWFVKIGNVTTTNTFNLKMIYIKTNRNKFSVYIPLAVTS